MVYCVSCTARTFYNWYKHNHYDFRFIVLIFSFSKFKHFVKNFKKIQTVLFIYVLDYFVRTRTGSGFFVNSTSSKSYVTISIICLFKWSRILCIHHFESAILLILCIHYFEYAILLFDQQPLFCVNNIVNIWKLFRKVKKIKESLPTQKLNSDLKRKQESWEKLGMHLTQLPHANREWKVLERKQPISKYRIKNLYIFILII